MQANKLDILPDPKDNIYNWNGNNVDSLFRFYFNKKGVWREGDLKIIYNNDHGLELNQREFIARNVSERMAFFKECLKPGPGGKYIENLMKYGIDAFFEDFSKFDMSWNRNKITVAFFELLLNSNK